MAYSSRGGVVRVLVADDDALLRRILQGHLIAEGHEPVFAVDGLDAWAKLQAEHIRMVIVDWLMPGMDGPELIRRIREAGWPGYTYIILLTVKGGRKAIVEGLTTGADDYVTKPFGHEELLARIGVGARILQLEDRLSASVAREEAYAIRDALTGLPNRRGLRGRAQIELSRAEREKGSVCLIMMDLDHFKEINDRFGHAAGDEALRRVAEVLQENRRDYDLAGRWGGEEFLVILPGTSLAQAGAVGERLRLAIQSIEMQVGGRDAVTIRASIGVAASSPAELRVGFDELVERADRAMYRAKQVGGNRVMLHALPTNGEPGGPVHSGPG
jgi:two-component system chemotaxis response regulator CheY